MVEMTTDWEIGSAARKLLLDPSPADGIKELLSRILNRVTLQIEKVMKMPGFAPRDRGYFASQHFSLLSEPLKKYILNPVRVGMNATYLGVSIYQNGESLWKFIVNGHRVLTTTKSRRWWFWYLKNELGGSYKRKTNGSPGYVPPDDYIQRAVNAVVGSGFVQKVAQEEIENYFK